MTSGPPSTPFSWHGATLVAESEGSGDPAFLLIHGIGMGRSVFTDLTRLLLPHGRVIAIDLPGYGEAPEPPRVLTIERTADLVGAFARQRGCRDLTVVGHSMGAQVASELAARHPEVVGRIVLAGPTVDPRARRASTQLARLARDIAVESPVVWARGAREYLRAGPNLRLKLRATLVHRLEQTLPRVAVPTLVLRGEDDVVAPRDWCEEVALLAARGSYIEIPGHGHETMIRDAAPAAAAIARFAASR
ncbi:alpha/beta fold hydrolase [Microbacterium sp. SS28]|uniref:alpha/beta fold hydrolase n=1 Tax=Microbacterium sp. SS28 TaxID=2919948 RepID=UPI001FAAED25|nr:alpha/beta hydrolase [Microbacterium sp. SS28]